MEFALDEEQKLLQQTLRRLLEDKSGQPGQAPTADRAAEYRTELAQLGAFGALVATDSGGSGLELLHAVLIGEEAGRACLPVCWYGAGVVAPLALRGAAAAGAEEVLAGLVRGEVTVGVALSHSVVAHPDTGVSASGGKLSGLSLMVSDCPGADAWVVADDSGALWLVMGDAEGVTTEAMPNIDQGRQFGSLQLANTPALALADADLQRLLQAGRIALAAETLGAAEHMLYRAVDYAGEREQFGRVIGSFQAVKHLCAEMAAEIEPARALVWYAAHRWDQGAEDAPWLACQAKSLLCEVGTFVARTATEVHGGMGFTQEYGLHAWFKRIGANRQLLGGPQRVREEAARLQGWA